MEPPRGNKRNSPPPPNWAPPPPSNWVPPPNHHQAPPPPNWAPPPNRYYTPPPPSAHYSQTHQKQYYTPQPASPAYDYNMAPSPHVEPHHFELAQSSEFPVFEDLSTDDVVSETPTPTPTATPTEVAEEEEDDEVQECDARGKKKFAGKKPREL
uniref:extensin-like n=1 Tax=Erigeron canadensis TaxID=72917 RepID=UPI001CB8ED64|nr:extensin-like [Erigeron canadensis]